MSQYDQKPPHMESPFNEIPPSIVALALIIFGVEVFFQIGNLGLIGGADAIGWRLNALQNYAFLDVIVEQMRELNMWPMEHLIRFLSYAFVHTSMTHALFACVFILALGKMVAQAFGDWAAMIIFFASTIFAALFFSLLIDTQRPLIGAMPPAYGFIGAYTYILWLGLGSIGANQMKAFSLIGFLLGIQLLFGLVFGGSIDWVADLIGFVCGFLLAAGLKPGALSAFVERLKGR